MIEEMVTPKVERENNTREFGTFIISPMERGFGLTLGNAIRRVLLSSLEGAAVTELRITDVMHEFSTIPGVREDVIQVMLQVKQIRMMLHGVDSAQIHLDVKGEGTFTAADIVCPPEVEIINPDLYLFSITEPSAHVEMDMTVELGRGYLPANDRPNVAVILNIVAKPHQHYPVHAHLHHVGAMDSAMRLHVDHHQFTAFELEHLVRFPVQGDRRGTSDFLLGQPQGCLGQFMRHSGR